MENNNSSISSTVLDTEASSDIASANNHQVYTTPRAVRPTVIGIQRNPTHVVHRPQSQRQQNSLNTKMKFTNYSDQYFQRRYGFVATVRPQNLTQSRRVDVSTQTNMLYQNNQASLVRNMAQNIVNRDRRMDDESSIASFMAKCLRGDLEDKGNRQR